MIQAPHKEDSLQSRKSFPERPREEMIRGTDTALGSWTEKQTENGKVPLRSCEKIFTVRFLKQGRTHMTRKLVKIDYGRFPGTLFWKSEEEINLREYSRSIYKP